jgi:DNA replication protein DnaC
MDVLRPVIDADVLVLDDLGAERTSEWVDETLNLIVNARYSDRRTTIFTSNYEDKGADNTDPDSLLFRIGYRMRSRLHEMCEFIDLDGADYRELPPNGGVEDLVMLWKLRTKASRKPTLPPRSSGQARAQLKDRDAKPDAKADLKWSGGRAGS